MCNKFFGWCSWNNFLLCRQFGKCFKFVIFYCDFGYYLDVCLFFIDRKGIIEFDLLGWFLD